MKVYLRLMSYARPLGGVASLYFLFSLLSALFSVGTITLLKPLLDVLFGLAEEVAVNQSPSFSFSAEYAEQLFYYQMEQAREQYGNLGTLRYVCVVVVFASFFRNLFRHLAQRVLEKVRARMVAGIRGDLFGKVQKLHTGFFTNEARGDLLSRMTADVQVVEDSLVSTFRAVLKEPVTLIGYLATLFILSPQLTLFAIIMIPLTAFVIGGLIKKIKTKAHGSQETLGRLTGQISEALEGQRVIKAFNAQEYINRKFDIENQRYSTLLRQMYNRFQMAPPLSEFMGILAAVAVLLYGGTLVLTNESLLSASEFITYLAVFSQVMTPAKSIASSVSGVQRGLVAGERIFSVMDVVPEIKDNENAKILETFNESIDLQTVSFAYDEKPVLQNINFTIKKGHTVALVGPSGGGKSTLADLIPRFYDPVQGQILIDGQDIKDFTLHSLRSKMGIVTQDCILFNDTIFNNIAFGAAATEEQIIQAAKVANAHDFIVETENGYRTNIGDRGLKLSGGQRQRLSIARAVLKNPEILILDEATSALDTESERLVQEALLNLMKDRTALVIAHRLSTVQHANQIIVIQNGQITEQGSHQELIQQPEGMYQKLVSLQMTSAT